MDLQRVSFYLLSIFLYFAESSSFRFDYKYYPNIDGWLKFHRLPATWHDAWTTCDLEGSILASPINPDMVSAMDAHWKSENTNQWTLYTGVHAMFSKGYFFSLEGVSLEKMPVRWAAGEPENKNNDEDCLAWVIGDVADVNCSKLYPFMCFKRKTKDMVTTSCGTVDKDYELSPLTGNCYKFHRRGRTWHQAQKTCAAEGGYLAVINSHEEALHLKKLFDDNYSKIVNSEDKDKIYVGMHDFYDPGVWRTIHGVKIEEAGYAEWSEHQSNNLTYGRHCGAMMNTLGLNDLWCDKSVAFICEKSLDSLVEDKVAE
ncbi:C-type mannose receptor 2-like [Melitaea cinxia]|uniref:C-type mannose receptor 2-like n=1 Tax=Melitaea cinxia TaxID=113334 RepID=UPI001E26FEA5|nr:C-type mannose receptor 2-like [Melitaea cinxia]